MRGSNSPIIWFSSLSLTVLLNVIGTRSKSLFFSLSAFQSINRDRAIWSWLRTAFSFHWNFVSVFFFPIECKWVWSWRCVESKTNLMKNYRLCYGEWLNFTMHKSDLLLFTFYRSNLTTIQRFCVQSSNSSLTFYYWHSILNYIHLATEAISIQNKNIHYKWVAIKENFYNIESMQLIRDTSLQFWLVCLQVTVFHRWSQQSEQRRQTLGNQYGLSSRMKKMVLQSLSVDISATKLIYRILGVFCIAFPHRK